MITLKSKNNKFQKALKEDCSWGGLTMKKDNLKFVHGIITDSRGERTSLAIFNYKINQHVFVGECNNLNTFIKIYKLIAKD